MTWSQARLDWLTSVSREVIDPRMLGDEEVVHYSIPALDTLGGPAVEPASSIASTKLRVRGGEVLVSKLNPRKLRVVTVKEHERPSMASGEFISLIPKNIDARFLSYWLRSEKTRQDLHGATQSVTRSHQRVTPDILTKKWLMVPSLAEQRAIADYLDTETARIDTLIAKKKALSQGVNERFQRTVHRDVEALVDQTGSTRLKRLAAISVGIVITPAAWYSDVGGVPALRGLNVRPRRLLVDDLISLSEDGHLANKKSELRAGDVVVVRTGQAGAAAVVPSSLDGCNCIDLLIVRRSPDLDPEFLSFVLNSEWVSKQIAEFSVGAIQSHFNVSALKELNFPLVPPPDQREVAARWRALEHDSDAVTERLDRQIALLDEHRRALTTAAVTGEMEVPGVAA